MLLLVRIPRPEASEEGKKAKGSIWREAMYGWGYIKQRPGLLGLLLFFAAINFTSGMGNVMLGPLVLSFAGTAELGTIITVLGIGMLFVVAGCLPVLAGLAAYAYPRVRRVEDELPDYVAEKKPEASPPAKEETPSLVGEEVAVGA